MIARVVATTLIIISIARPALANFIFAQQTNEPSVISQADIYVKVIGGIIAGIGALLGLPLAIVQFQKTRAEIRKLEREANELQANSLSAATWQGHRIVIENSDYATVHILADPRFLGPLLLLLDFIIAWIILTLADYAIGLFIHGPIRTIIMGLLAVVLLVPIGREARRVRKILRPQKENAEDAENANK